MWQYIKEILYSLLIIQYCNINRKDNRNNGGINEVIITSSEFAQRAIENHSVCHRLPTPASDRTATGIDHDKIY
jgi:hypothetical protein